MLVCYNIEVLNLKFAWVVELVVTVDLGSIAARRESSSLSLSTIIK